MSDREEAAFVSLVRRHRPRVERICRCILSNEHDVEDAIQATFLVLARKAAGIDWRESVGPWIDGVARRQAMHMRARSARLRSRETAVTSLAGGPTVRDGRLPEWFHPTVEPSAEVERRDLRRVLDDELLRLPEKYRAPVVLCDLEGHTREEAARRLGWPAGSMSRRLDRGRSLLRRRLTHRGVALGVVGLIAMAAAIAIGSGSDHSRADSSVRRIMVTLRVPSMNGDDYASILAEAARGERGQPDFARVLPAARAAASVARRIEGLGPGRLTALWGGLASEMSDSAAELERACEQADAMALASAARRLDASCVRCHAVFRPGSAGIREVGRVSVRTPLLSPSGRTGPRNLERPRAVEVRVPRALAASSLRSPASSGSPSLADSVSNEWMGLAVLTEDTDPDRGRPFPRRSNLRRSPVRPRRLDAPRPRAGPDRGRAC